MLGLAFIIAIAVLAMGMALPILDEKIFFYFYTSAIGGAFVLINLSINLFTALQYWMSLSPVEYS